ncbi:DeoR/GlpR family DNA-binding transcription regulator [Peribacillus sp. SCS-155]|uniref:DeoR/GlpR family DNA-binding transcription regulator n=1 Tax=Peribacillus sedimenti TaxID=3115297 RepID=UPI0039067ED6
MSKLFATERRQKILDLLHDKQRITVKELSEKLHVSEATLRTDLNVMEEEGLLVRTHGGAMIDDKNRAENTFSEREKKNRSEKKKIGRKAMEFIHNGQCILLDASSTCLELAYLLKHTSMRLTVVTNGVTTAMELRENPNLTVILLGGILRNSSVALEGLLGSEILKQIHVDTMFSSAKGFTLEEGLTDFNVYEVELKKFLVNSSSRLIALLDHTKIGRSSIASFASTDKVDTIITDEFASESYIKEIERQQINLIVV